MKILIAEDDPVSSLVLETKLRKLGHEVLSAQNGRDAWHVFLRDKPRIVITDWMMPVIDGLELCRMIRAEGHAPYTYIIMLTALAGRENYLEGMNAGADDFISKPFDIDGLNARLRVAERVVGLQTTVSQLEGLLPICAYCKKIRDENNNWHQLENFVGARTDTSFAHKKCPECAKREAAEATQS